MDRTLDRVRAARKAAACKERRKSAEANQRWRHDAARLILRLMSLQPLVPQFQVRQARRGQGWLVHASWSSGRTADIPGFATESEADDWIRSESPAWLAARLTGSRD